MHREIIKANIVVFIASFCTLVIELIAGRIMAPFIGVSLYTWTSIIGVVLGGISVGAYLGGLLADRYPTQTTLGVLLILSGLGAFAISPLTTYLGGSQWNASLMIRILIITTLIFFAPSCVLGMISPVVVKLALNNLDKTGNIVGKIYAFSTLGSILGTFATGFFLISWMGTRHILFSTGGILMVSGVVFGGFLSRKKIFMAVGVGLFIPFLGVFYGHAFKPPLEGRTYFYKESNYYTIQLKKKDGTNKGSALEALVLDHLIHSYTDLDDPLHLEYEYTRLYEELVRWQTKGKQSFRALFIGGGGYTFPRFLEAKYPGAQIDVVEIDPEVSRVARVFLGLPWNTTRIRTFNEDARWFVMNCKESGVYDFIFGDAFNDLSIPYHLTTKEFDLELRRLLKPDGLYMVDVIDSFKKGLFIPAYIRTLEEVFGEERVNLVIANTDINDMGISTYVVVASSKDLEQEDFVEDMKRLGDTEVIALFYPQSLLQPYLKDHAPVILTDDYVPVDNLIAPIFEERYGYRK
jgi:spermidine synthase